MEGFGTDIGPIDNKLFKLLLKSILSTFFGSIYEINSSSYLF